MFILRELLSGAPKKKGTALRTALQRFNNTTRQRSIAFILSDFIDANYEDALRIAGNKHDIIGIKIYDKMDMHLPKLGMLRVRDMETEKERWVDTNSGLVRFEYEKEFFRVTDYANTVFKKAGCDLLHLRTDEDYVKVLKRFFLSRA